MLLWALAGPTVNSKPMESATTHLIIPTAAILDFMEVKCAFMP
jgi:hypothetical protein